MLELLVLVVLAVLLSSSSLVWTTFANEASGSQMWSPQKRVQTKIFFWSTSISAASSFALRSAYILAFSFFLSKGKAFA